MYSNAEFVTILVAVQSKRTRIEEISEHLDELEFLAKTIGICTKKRITQRLLYPDKNTFVRKGKLEEIKQIIFLEHISHVIFNDDLTPSQLRNIEKKLNLENNNCKVQVYDRSLLIFDIFLQRAQSSQARVQVELAMNQYLLPRLTKMWTHLERQRGGTGTRGGAGEKEIETDRRNINHRILVLKKKLIKIDCQNKNRRKTRQNIVRISLVGYTNTGKSTLMNLLSKTTVKAENKLFSTIDTIVRRTVINNLPFLLSDTVGFIRKLPTHLIESFKSTLDEVKEANLLLHVVDVSHPAHFSHIETVNKTLVTMEAGHIPVILILNKIDLLEKKEKLINLDTIKNNYQRYGFAGIVLISAKKKNNIDLLKKNIFHSAKKIAFSLYPPPQDTTI